MVGSVGGTNASQRIQPIDDNGGASSSGMNITAMRNTTAEPLTNNPSTARFVADVGSYLMDGGGSLLKNGVMTANPFTLGTGLVLGTVGAVMKVGGTVVEAIQHARSNAAAGVEPQMPATVPSHVEIDE